MNDGGLVPTFAYSAELTKRAAETESLVEQAFRKTYRSGIWKNVVIALLLIACFLQAIVNAFAVPNIHFVPVFFWARPDGVVETAITTDSLPMTMSDDIIKGILWRYIVAREEYSWVEADFNHYLVIAMSSRPVAEAYEAWSSGANKESYLARYGDRCIIKVDRLDEDVDWKPAINGQKGHYQLRFNRLFQCQGEPRRIETWTVSLGFVQNYRANLRVHDVKAFNQARIVVTEYPGATQLAGKPAATGVYPR